MGVYKMDICFLPTLCLHRGLRFRMTYKNACIGWFSFYSSIFIFNETMFLSLRSISYNKIICT